MTLYSWRAIICGCEDSKAIYERGGECPGGKQPSRYIRVDSNAESIGSLLRDTSRITPITAVEYPNTLLTSFAFALTSTRTLLLTPLNSMTTSLPVRHLRLPRALRRAFSTPASTKENLVILGSGWGGYNVLNSINKDKYNVTLIRLGPSTIYHLTSCPEHHGYFL